MRLLLLSRPIAPPFPFRFTTIREAWVNISGNNQPEDSYSRILLINNSSLAFTRGRTNTLGIMHKAEILNPDERESRIVNSVMIVMEGDETSVDQQREFVASNEISRKAYDPRAATDVSRPRFS